MVRRNDQARPQHCSPVFNDANALVEYVGTAMDITERKQAEEELRKAHEQVDLILASISISVSV